MRTGAEHEGAGRQPGGRAADLGDVLRARVAGGGEGVLGVEQALVEGLVGLGFGRIVASETEIPIMLVNTV